MTTLEQEQEKAPHMSSVLWNMFTGSAPYKAIFVSTLHPGFIGSLVWNLVHGFRPSAGNGKAA